MRAPRIARRSAAPNLPFGTIPGLTVWRSRPSRVAAPQPALDHTAAFPRALRDADPFLFQPLDDGVVHVRGDRGEDAALKFCGNCCRVTDGFCHGGVLGAAVRDEGRRASLAPAAPRLHAELVLQHHHVALAGEVPQAPREQRAKHVQRRLRRVRRRGGEGAAGAAGGAAREEAEKPQRVPELSGRVRVAVVRKPRLLRDQPPPVSVRQVDGARREKFVEEIRLIRCACACGARRRDGPNPDGGTSGVFLHDFFAYLPRAPGLRSFPPAFRTYPSAKLVAVHVFSPQKSEPGEPVHHVGESLVPQRSPEHGFHFADRRKGVRVRVLQRVPVRETFESKPREPQRDGRETRRQKPVAGDLLEFPGHLEPRRVLAGCEHAARRPAELVGQR
ncbi:MAG: hypothetical protein BJ554DRAFT_788 [Olpidium bornovanus]|uniref:Uncharacterized protein n=1 Tax=Olpidium bornovanus TaxID=278681 RepID=A0A8H8DHW0_9FUNG|nr:MAG: hypothetical protein BJ554DRAFT_788 [Olpidium bornovanus]